MEQLGQYLELEVGKTLTIVDGVEISALFQPEDSTQTDETDDHEAAHAVLARRVREVSCIPTSYCQQECKFIGLLF